MFLRYAYILFLGLFLSALATFIVSGVSTIYPAPEYPQPPVYQEHSFPDQYFSQPPLPPSPIPSLHPTKIEQVELDYQEELTRYNEQKAEQERIDKEFLENEKEYNQAFAKYNGTMLLIQIGIAMLFALLALLLHSRLPVISEGFLAAGVILLYYFSSSLSLMNYSGGQSMYSLTGVIIMGGALILLLIAGYFVFVRGKTKTA